ncbi:MAG: RNA polymerase sigma factor [Marinifilaceae bacterium]
MTNLSSMLQTEKQLIKGFNKKNRAAFGQIYTILHQELTLYASTIFNGTNESTDDIIQDIFLKIWDDGSVQFESIARIKAFIFVSIKNSYKNHIRSLHHQNQYHDYAEKEFIYDIMECEAYIKLVETLGILPQDCATVIRMYLEGYKPDEIAATLNYKPQTIYNKKQEAITRLKNKINKTYMFISIFNL